MRLTQVLNGPPVFRFWKEFGAGKDLKKRNGYFNYWRYMWNAYVGRMKIADKTLPADRLPQGARVMNAEDFLAGRIDAMPEELMSISRGEKVVYDHPWPYNVELDPIKRREPIHLYTNQNRFFFPSDDCQNLTNTLIETQTMEACPPIEPQAHHLDQVRQKIDWATSGDSVLIGLPRKREYPKINLRPLKKYGITDERAESNVLKSLANQAQTILAQNQHLTLGNFEEYLGLNHLSYPHCRVLLERESKQVGLELFIDHMTVSRKRLPIIDNAIEETRSREIADIRPRTWKSLLEKTRYYDTDWSFVFPPETHPRTIYLARRIKRNVDDEEMLARNVIHAYGITSHLAQSAKQMDKPMLPLAVQVISFRLEPERAFFFTRFQLNSLEFSGLKNQAWHSGPVTDLESAFRYFLDFECIRPEQDKATDENEDVTKM